MIKKTSMNNEQIETQGIAFLELCLSKCGNISTAFNKQDKNPLWDGHILLYENNNFSNANLINRIPVQLKASTKYNIDNEFQIFYLSRSNLNLYFKDGGVFLFLICLGMNDQHNIYYEKLSPIKIKLFLRNNETTKNIPISLSLFPKDNPIDCSNILRNSAVDFNIKPSDKILSFHDYQKYKPEGYNELSISFFASEHSDPLDYVLSRPVSLTARNKSAGTELPLGDVQIQKIGRKIYNKSIEINGIKYYDTFDVIKEKEKFTFIFGKSLILINYKNKGLKYDFKLTGFLPERIWDLNFFLSLLKFKKMKVGNEDWIIKISEQESKEDTLEYDINKLNNLLVFYSDIQSTLNILGVKRQIDFDNLDEIDTKNIRFLISAINNKKPQQLNGYNDGITTKNLKIGDYFIRILLEKDEKGFYKVYNYFNKEFHAFYPKNDSKNNYFYGSPYLMLEKTDFLKIINIDYNIIYDSFICLPDDIGLFDTTLSFIPEMLSAYDELLEKDLNLLTCSFKLCDWLLTKNLSDRDGIITLREQISTRLELHENPGCI